MVLCSRSISFDWITLAPYVMRIQIPSLLAITYNGKSGNYFTSLLWRNIKLFEKYDKSVFDGNLRNEKCTLISSEIISTFLNELLFFLENEQSIRRTSGVDTIRQKESLSISYIPLLQTSNNANYLRMIPRYELSEPLKLLSPTIREIQSVERFSISVRHIGDPPGEISRPTLRNWTVSHPQTC